MSDVRPSVGDTFEFPLPLNISVQQQSLMSISYFIKIEVVCVCVCVCVCACVNTSKAFRTDGSNSPKNNFNKVPRLWTCQTYSENMSSVLKSEAILFEALFFVVAKAASVLDVLTFLPSLL